MRWRRSCCAVSAVSGSTWMPVSCHWANSGAAGATAVNSPLSAPLTTEWCRTLRRANGAPSPLGSHAVVVTSCSVVDERLGASSNNNARTWPTDAWNGCDGSFAARTRPLRSVGAPALLVPGERSVEGMMSVFSAQKNS